MARLPRFYLPGKQTFGISLQREVAIGNSSIPSRVVASPYPENQAMI